MARYTYSIVHVSGKLLYTADTLSRAPLSTSMSEITLQDSAEHFIHTVVSSLPVSESRLETYREAQRTDPVCSLVIHYCRQGWPRTSPSSNIGPYWRVRGNLSVHNQVLLYGGRIVVPPALQKETLQAIHEGHQGIVHCRLRIKRSVWWPGISTQVTEMISNCKLCAKEQQPQREPLMPSPLPEYPWHIVGSDLFQIKNTHYLLIVDYFSRFPEVVRLPSTTTSAVIHAMKGVFARHGLPEMIRSDNSPQYSSQEFDDFAKSYNFKHVTSSPRYPQSNGLAERMVKTVKKLITLSPQDPQKVLLSYRTTPLSWCGHSPAELLMGRQL